MLRNKAVTVFAIVSCAVIIAVAPRAEAQETINPADYSNIITNPYFPVSSLQTLSFAGEEEDPDTGETIETSGEWTILPGQKTVAGVNVLVVRDDAFEDGELVESTLDYFAQHRDGTVYYFGEDVDNYENGVVVNHDGSWLAGEGENLPGVFMPASPKAGDTFDQERAPGIAEDHSEVLEVGLTVTVPAGSFSNCIKTEDVNPLDAAAHVENKFYCPGVGFVKETAEGVVLELASFTRPPAAASTATPSAATAVPPTATRPAGGAQGVTAPNTGSGDGSDAAEMLLWVVPAVALAFGGGAAATYGLMRRRA
jgi:hypothetical protein